MRGGRPGGGSPAALIFMSRLHLRLEIPSQREGLALRSIAVWPNSPAAPPASDRTEPHIPHLGITRQLAEERWS